MVRTDGKNLFCSKCGCKISYVDTNAILTSNPPKYKVSCNICNNVDYVNCANYHSMSSMTEKPYKILVLIGKSGSGKDYILKKLLSMQEDLLNEIVSSTTRPPRDYEKNGESYNFLTHSEFAEKIVNSNFLEFSYFNENFYGTEYSSLDKNKINIGVFNPDGIKTLFQKEKEGLIECKIIYIHASEKTRLIRQLERENNPNIKEIFRRYEADEEDFKKVPFNCTTLMNDNNINLTNENIANIINMIENWAE